MKAPPMFEPLEWEEAMRVGDLERYIAEADDPHVWAQIERTRFDSAVFACWLLTFQTGSLEITSEARSLEEAKAQAEAFRVMLPRWNNEVLRRLDQDATHLPSVP